MERGGGGGGGDVWFGVTLCISFIQLFTYVEELCDVCFGVMKD